MQACEKNGLQDHKYALCGIPACWQAHQTGQSMILRAQCAQHAHGTPTNCNSQFAMPVVTASPHIQEPQGPLARRTDPRQPRHLWILRRKSLGAIHGQGCVQTGARQGVDIGSPSALVLLTRNSSRTQGS